MAIDTICEMNIDEENAAAKTEHSGKTYYFCVPGCKITFEEEPERYVE